jgi:hypothetical protein
MAQTYETRRRSGKHEGSDVNVRRARTREDVMKTEAMSREQEALKQRRAQLEERLKALKVARVEVEYDGCGDSGDVQEVHALLAGGEAADLKGQSVMVERLESVYDHEAKDYRRVTSQQTVSLKEALGDFAVDFLSFLGIDWYNNDGGYGTVVLDVKDGKVKAEHNYRIESSEYEEHEL